MIYLALAALGCLLANVAAFAGLVRSLLRTHARERDLMLNQILHLAGRTWQPPPPPPPEPNPVPDVETPQERYVAFPVADFD